ncbi:MAG: alanine racemase [Gemmatimonadetes bacterium]|nr:alanine racemase [Gemmatimonadota bacterium]NNM07126.1 alanine racemase [Gemmatimonadota bacterium]
MDISRRRFLGAAALASAPGFFETSEKSDHPKSARTGEELERPGGPSLSRRERFDPWVEIIPGHLRAATAEVRRLSGDRPILAVVKNNGYGLGVGTVGALLDGDPGILGFAVVKGEEALLLRSAGVRKPILLMGLFAPEEGPDLARAGVEFSVFTPDAAGRLLPLARSVGRPLPIHFYLDTGMGRMGMSYRHAVPWMTELARSPEIRIQGTFTELGEDRAFDPEQLQRFLTVVRDARRTGLETGRLHAAASNGVFHLPEGHLDLVRPGIALFGSYPSDPKSERRMATLRSALRFRTRVVRVSRLEPGDGVGYGRPWIADRPTWVATLPVGHADGYPREAVNGAEVLIGENLYPVIGAVSASHCIAEVGDHLTVRLGDPVTLMGPDRPSLEPNNMAERLGVSVYDLLMHVNPGLPRILVSD